MLSLKEGVLAISITLSKIFGRATLTDNIDDSPKVTSAYFFIARDLIWKGSNFWSGNFFPQKSPNFCLFLKKCLGCGDLFLNPEKCQSQFFMSSRLSIQSSFFERRILFFVQNEKRILKFWNFLKIFLKF